MPINRRQWLKHAGLAAGLLPFLPPTTSAAGPMKYIPDLEDDFYFPPEKLIKLSSNENPYGPSAFVKEAMVNGFDAVCRYPGPERTALKEKLAAKEGVSPEHILLTVGSTEGLKITALAYGLNGGEVIAGNPTFETMLRYAEHYGAHVHRVPVREDDLLLDLEEMEKRITGNTRLIFLCNPNNPTGTLLPKQTVRDFCQSVQHQTMVFSDEAYYDYITSPDYPSMVELVKENLNVIVSRTFSKVYGLAGIRLGYLIARPDIVSRIARCRTDRPNMLSLYAATAALGDDSFYQFSLDMNKKAKNQIYTALDQMGLAYVKSHTNFIFFKSGMDIKQFNQSMQEQGVKVGRPFPPFNDWCRISTGKQEDMKTFIQAMQKVLG